MKIVTIFFKTLLYTVCFIFNKVIPKQKNKILFIPLPNCRKDKSDLINYTSDNVLSFLHYALHHNEKLEYYVQVYDINKIQEYKTYCQEISPNLKVHFFLSEYFVFEDYPIYKSVKIWLNNFFIFCRCSKVFTSAYWYNFIYKTSHQEVICLNYFIPFKLDTATDRMKKTFNISFDYCLTTSLLAAQIDSISSGLSLDKYLTLGFARNDNLLLNDKKDKLISELSTLAGYKILKVIVYTPTYRDYDYATQEKRNILGFNQDNNELSELLEKSNAILLVKLHPLQNINVYYELKCSNIVLLQADGVYGLYDYLSISNLLITDYTSTYFDFLLMNKPIIFNFFDKDLYEKERGFSYDPIENICSGNIVYNYEDMLNAIQTILSEKYIHDVKQNLIMNLFHKYEDNLSSERIYNYFFK